MFPIEQHRKLMKTKKTKKTKKNVKFQLNKMAN